MTEEENKKQYESFVTSAINSGTLDAIVGYKEWLETIRGYTPIKQQLPTNDLEYYQFYDTIDRLNKATTMSIAQLRKVLKND